MSLPISQNIIPFDKLAFQKYPLHKLASNHKKPIFGLDTETLHGYCRLIADNKGWYLHTDNFDDCIGFLTSKRFRSAHNFFYNLNYDINAILKYSPPEILADLYNTKRASYQGMDFFYIPKKLFKITKNRHVYKFYDIFQFYNTSLEYASKRYLGLNKYIDPIDRVRLGSDPDYWADNHEAIIRYCVNDCKLTAKLGSLLHDKLVTALDFQPDSFISKAGLTKQYVRKACDIPQINDIPPGALKYSFNSYSGGRFEMIKKGNVGKCSLYDINSAYPYHIKNLIDINQGRWVRVSNFHDDAYYGFYLCKVFVKYQTIAPISIMSRSGTIIYPVIDCYKYLTKNEILAYENYCDISVIDGWEYYPDKIIYPFKDYITQLHDIKNQTPKTNYEYSLYKILMNSLYGCFYEKYLSDHDDCIITGKLFNPIYASMITANTRIDLYNLAKPFESQAIGFATDSVLFQGDPDIKTGNKLGDWDCEARLKDTTILRSGIYQIGDQLKSRGIKKTSNIQTPTGHYPDLFGYIKAKPFWTKYPIIMNRPLTFVETLLRRKYSQADINIFTDIEYSLDINSDQKRIWTDSYNNGIELFNHSIDSHPLILSFSNQVKRQAKV